MFGQYALQGLGDLAFIEYLLGEFCPEAILELGCGHGMLTAYLTVYKKLTGAKLLAVDTNLPLADAAVKAGVIDPACLYAKDMLQDLDKPIIEFVGLPKCLVLCDCANKPAVITKLGPHLSKGSVMAAHDWPFRYDVKCYKEPREFITTEYVTYLESESIEIGTDWRAWIKI